MEQVYRMLVRGLEAARSRGAGRRRARELAVLLDALRERGPDRIVRCAWCGRIAGDDEHWFDPTPLLEPALLQRLERLASHGICPRCFDRTQREAERERLTRLRPEPEGAE